MGAGQTLTLCLHLEYLYYLNEVIDSVQSYLCLYLWYFLKHRHLKNIQR